MGTRDFRQSWIHLCPSNPQGMSLDCVEISLGRVFASGQAYVALSRARSLQSLRVLDFDPTVVRCNPRVLRFYAALRRGRGLGLVRGCPPVVGSLGARTGKAQGPGLGVAEPSLASLETAARGRRAQGCGSGGQHKPMTRLLWLSSRSPQMTMRQPQTRRTWTQTFEPQKEDKR